MDCIFLTVAHFWAEISDFGNDDADSVASSSDEDSLAELLWSFMAILQSGNPEYPGSDLHSVTETHALTTSGDGGERMLVIQALNIEQETKRFNRNFDNRVDESDEEMGKYGFSRLHAENGNSECLFSAIESSIKEKWDDEDRECESLNSADSLQYYSRRRHVEQERNAIIDRGRNPSEAN